MDIEQLKYEDSAKTKEGASIAEKTNYKVSEHTLNSRLWSDVLVRKDRPIIDENANI